MDIAFGPLSLSPFEFWQLTPAEVYRLSDGWKWRDEHEKERIAWQTAILINVQLEEKDRVTVGQLLGREELPSEQTEEDKTEEFARLMQLMNERKQTEDNANP